ncbi:MAG TPA: FecR domain-containing protein [Pirellulaceae bacterium]|nr:FecR domain-containing protein [Pirellulaceae bacterium]
MRRMAASTPSPPTATRPRHFLRYSLRGLLIFLTLACVGVWYWYRVPYVEEVRYPEGPKLWEEKSGYVALAKQEQRYRRVPMGEPIREGLTEWFDAQGRRLCEERWLEGRPHGVSLQLYTNGKVRERSEYSLGRRIGTWEGFDEAGRLSVRMPFDNGDPHDTWEWFADGKRVRTITFDHTEVKQIDGRPIDDPLGRACRLGQIDNERIQEMLTALDNCDFRSTPLISVVRYVSEKFKVNIELDRSTLRDACIGLDLSITLREDRITAGAKLVLLFEPHDLAATYRFGMIWITTKEDAKNWVDRTGIASVLKSPPPEVLPADRSKIAAAFQGPAEFDFVDTPLQDVADFLSEIYRVPITCEADMKDIPLNSNVRGISLQNALGALCDQYGLRVRWKDTKALIIESQDGAEKWRRR